MSKGDIINKANEEDIRNLISSMIRDSNIVNGKFAIVPNQDLEKKVLSLLKRNVDAAKTLMGNTGEFPIIKIVSNSIHHELKNKELDPEGWGIRGERVFSSDEVESILESIIQSIKQLSVTGYVYYIKLKLSNSDFIHKAIPDNGFPLYEGVTLLKESSKSSLLYDENHNQDYPLFLEIRKIGFLTNGMETPLSIQINSLLEDILSFLHFIDLIVPGEPKSLSLGTLMSGLGKRTGYSVTTPEGDTFSNYVTNEVENLIDFSPSASAQKDSILILSKLRGLRFVLQENKTSERLIRASKWYSLSLRTSNKMMSLLLKVVSLEALYGSNNITEDNKRSTTQLSARMQDRCSFSLAENSKERQKIAKLIRDAYKVRSDFVHYGWEDKTESVQTLYSNFNQLCHRAIINELNFESFS